MGIHRTVYSSGPIQLKEITQTCDGKAKTRLLLDMGGEAVIIIPELAQGTYVMIKQARTGDAAYEFPSGGIKQGESPLQAAARELREEIGGRGDLTYLGSFQPLLGLVDMRVHVVHASQTLLEPGEESREFYEKMSVYEMTHDELEDKLRTNQFQDGYIYAAMGMLFARKGSRHIDATPAE